MKSLVMASAFLFSVEALAYIPVTTAAAVAAASASVSRVSRRRYEEEALKKKCEIERKSEMFHCLDKNNCTVNERSQECKTRR